MFWFTDRRQITRERLEEIRSYYQTEGDSMNPSEPIPLVLRMIQRGSKLSDQEIVSECMSHMSVYKLFMSSAPLTFDCCSTAGVDTSSSTLGFMFWELTRRPDLISNLRRELDELFPDRLAIPNNDWLLKQPYLNAFIREGASVRRHPRL